jgi:four helix bundle protein
MGMVPNIPRVGSMFWDPKLASDMRNPAPLTIAIRSYRDLRVWQQSMDLAETIYQITKTFPDTERYGLISQLRRAAASVASNIAEGHTRSLGDYIRHLLISNGSLAEIETQLILSQRLGILSTADADQLLRACEQLGRGIGALRKSLGARRRSLTPNPSIHTASP